MTFSLIKTREHLSKQPIIQTELMQNYINLSPSDTKLNHIGQFFVQFKFYASLEKSSQELLYSQVCTSSKMIGVQMKLSASVCEEQFYSPATSSELDLDFHFDQAILTHEFTLI